MAEGVDRAGDIGTKVLRRDKDDARRAEREQGIAVAHRTDAGGACGIVAAAAGDRDRRHAP